jgi:2,4-dienoyl-CoA reductase-like NADH-dependent reductase (Old Yellow Enzyme family)
MVPWRATGDGQVTDDNLDWYGRFAEGQPGVIVVEATGVRDLASGPLIRIGHDRFIPGLTRLVERVREASGGKTKLLIQIIDFLTVRRRPPKDKFFRKYLELTDRHRQALAGTASSEEEIREILIEMPEDELQEILTQRELEALQYGYRERVSDVEKPHIAELPKVLPEVFSAAAYRAEQAGFDGVELHYAHAYTMASFLSARNTRTDGYGGPPENRVRLPLEVFAAVRAAVGRNFTVGCRFLSEECIEGGSSLEDAIVFGLSFARAGMDFLSLSRGGKFEDAKQPKVGSAVYPYTGRSGYECMPTVRSDKKGPFGRNVPYCAAIRRALRAAGFETPVVAAGGICSFEQAESILLAGEADIIGAARQSLADPDWFLKIRLGRGEEIRRCKFTNYCEALDQKHKKVTCQLWDRVDRDQPGVTLSEDGRRRLVAPDWSREP